MIKMTNFHAYCICRRLVLNNVSRNAVRVTQMRYTVPGMAFGSRAVTRTLTTQCVSRNKQSAPHSLTNPITSSIQTARYSLKTDISQVPKHDPEKGDLVYLGTLSGVVRVVKAFSLSTSIMGLLLQPFLYKNIGDSIVVKIALGGTISFFIFLTPLLLHWVTKRYVSTVYYDARNDTFTATTYSLFLREKLHRFTADQVTVPEIPGLFTTVKINNNTTPLFLDANMFLSKDALLRLMGYDKPFDWEIPPQDEVEEEDQDNHTHKK